MTPQIFKALLLGGVSLLWAGVLVWRYGRADTWQFSGNRKQPLWMRLLSVSGAGWYPAFCFWFWTSNHPLVSLFLETAGTAGDVKVAYAASSAVTQTNLDGLAASATWVAGWESGAFDNSSNLYTDYIVNAKLQAESTNNQAGQARVYGIAEQDDSTWPDVIDGTESTETLSDVGTRDGICSLFRSIDNDNTASQVWYINCGAVAWAFGGPIPRKWVVFITHTIQTTTNVLETTGDPNQVYVKGVYNNVAQS